MSKIPVNFPHFLDSKKHSNISGKIFEKKKKKTCYTFELYNAYIFGNILQGKKGYPVLPKIRYMNFVMNVAYKEVRTLI
jgi:hypothetical protein